MGDMVRNYLPEFKESNLDIAGYEVVFVGTHDGYGAGHSYQTIADAGHASVSLDGIAIEAKDVPRSETAIQITIDDIT